MTKLYSSLTLIILGLMFIPSAKERTLPIGFKDDLPFGVNVTSKIFTELNLFTAANAIEEITGFSNLSVNNYKNKEEK